MIHQCIETAATQEQLAAMGKVMLDEFKNVFAPILVDQKCGPEFSGHMLAGPTFLFAKVYIYSP